VKEKKIKAGKEGARIKKRNMSLVAGRRSTPCGVEDPPSSIFRQAGGVGEEKEGRGDSVGEKGTKMEKEKPPTEETRTKGSGMMAGGEARGQGHGGGAEFLFKKCTLSKRKYSGPKKGRLSGNIRTAGRGDP